MVEPIHDYALEADNCAVTGGFVYRGSRIPTLQGVYVYGDFCAGRLLGLRRDGGQITHQDLGLDVNGLSSFGEDHAGELYAMSLGDGGLYRIDSS
jgi:hypothetical protein